MNHPTSIARLAACAGSAVLLSSCVSNPTGPPDERHLTQALRADIDTIVVIYAENRGFDSLYGNFKGARGLSEVQGGDGKPNASYHPQLDRDGKPLAALPPAWGGVTESGYAPVVTQQQSVGLPNAPFSIEHAYTAQSGVTLSTASVTRDLWHRFFEHQMQIDGGKNDGFAAWSDAGGLALGHYDYSASALYHLAHEFVLADNFFQGAFGGSFLNHQYLICACAPEYPDADSAPAKPSIALLEQDAAGHYLPRLKTAQNPPASALDEPPRFARSGNIAPKGYFGDGRFYAVNTMQPPYQPSGVGPAAGDASLLYADPNDAGTLPPQSQPTIGDELDGKGVSWSWYAGSWQAAIADGRRDAKLVREVIYAPVVPGGSPDFQAHHQPFNYYRRFDPAAHADDRAAHLKDLGALYADIDRGSLPHVVFYKPQGNLNQHPGYASLDEGDAHIAELVQKLRASAQWPHMLILITYDEYGGAWDHVAPPAGDLLGPGSRIPAIIVSPFARKGSVDHTQYDTESILKLITRRFDLAELPGMKMREQALAAHGGKPMGDLTNALELR